MRRREVTHGFGLAYITLLCMAAILVSSTSLHGAGETSSTPAAKSGPDLALTHFSRIQGTGGSGPWTWATSVQGTVKNVGGAPTTSAAVTVTCDVYKQATKLGPCFAPKTFNIQALGPGQASGFQFKPQFAAQFRDCGKPDCTMHRYTTRIVAVAQRSPARQVGTTVDANPSNDQKALDVQH